MLILWGNFFGGGGGGRGGGVAPPSRSRYGWSSLVAAPGPRWVLVCLAQGVFDRLADAVGAVERWDDHADQGFRHGVARHAAPSDSHEGKYLRVFRMPGSQLDNGCCCHRRRAGKRSLCSGFAAIPFM